DRAGMHAPGHEHMPGQPQRHTDAPDDIWSKLEDMAPEDERRPGDMPPPRDTHDAERPRIDVPFEHLEEHGFFNGLSETIKRICLSPRLFFATMPLDTGKKRPFAFYMLTGMLSAYFQTAWQTMGLDLTTYIFPQSSNVESASTAATLAALVMVLPILLAVGIMVTSGITHLALMPFKAAKNGFTTTFRVCSYASAPTLLAAVPLIGPLAGSFWYLGLIIIGLKHAHETSYTRVTIALGIPFILFTAFVTAVLLAAGPGQQPVF
ncbi:YIP1 family protein, partial [Desulfobaculum sp.]